MTVPITLSMTGDQHDRLKQLLFPGDGKESVAIMLCGRRDGDRRHRLVVRAVEEIPIRDCSIRTPVQVTWPPDVIAPLLNRAATERLTVVKIHSHPGGCANFSDTDDRGDAKLLPMIRGWIEADIPHGSAVMLPSGQMFGRVLQPDGSTETIELINVVGDDLHFWYAGQSSVPLPSYVASHAQAFDVGTIEQTSRLSIAVIGCSGTGSPVVEQCMRLGAGEIILVDDDRVEDRNVNRILNSTMRDARDARLKVDVLGDAIARTELGTRVTRLSKSLWDPDVIRIVAQCDLVIGCMDTIDGRFLLNTLATYYTLPYIDVGVRLDTVRTGSNQGHIREICGSVHYLQPGRSSLMSRGVFTMPEVAAAGLRRNDPTAHAREIRDGYIKGVVAHRPAVITVNMFAAALAVTELLARLHPFREEPNSSYAATTFSFGSMELITDPEGTTCPILCDRIGIGDAVPLLGLLELAERRTG